MGRDQPGVSVAECEDGSCSWAECEDLSGAADGLPVGVGGVSSGPTSDAALATTTGQRPLHHSNHPHRDMVTLPADTPTQYASWIEHAVGGGTRYPSVPREGAARLRVVVGGVTPPHTPGPNWCPRHC